jgi:hypothetical protein
MGDILDQERFSGLSDQPRDPLPQIDLVLSDFFLPFPDGDLEIKLLGFRVEKQQRTRFSLHHFRRSIDDELKKLVQVEN